MHHQSINMGKSTISISKIKYQISYLDEKTSSLLPCVLSIGDSPPICYRDSAILGLFMTRAMFASNHAQVPTI